MQSTCCVESLDLLAPDSHSVVLGLDREMRLNPFSWPRYTVKGTKSQYWTVGTPAGDRILTVNMERTQGLPV